MSYNEAREHGRTRAGIAGMALILGIAAAGVCGAIWAGIATLTGYEVGYVAWGVGLVVGLAVAIGAKEPNVGHGITAAGLAAAGLLLGKLLIFQWAMPGFITKEFAKDPQMHAAAVEMLVVKDPDLDPAFKTWYDNQDPSKYTEEQDKVYYAQLEQMIAERSARMTQAEHDDADKAMAGAAIASIPLDERLSMSFSPWDFLWFGLALFTAFKVGSGAAAAES